MSHPRIVRYTATYGIHPSEQLDERIGLKSPIEIHRPTDRRILARFLSTHATESSIDGA
jgi:hypothetical protein